MSDAPVIEWTARAEHRAHWRCKTCGAWTTITSKSGGALIPAELTAERHVQMGCQP